MSKAQNMPWDHMIRTSVNYGSVLQNLDKICLTTREAMYVFM